MDIVERLRVRNVPYGWPELADKAAAEIERLRAENGQLLERVGELYRAQKSRILSARSAEVKALSNEQLAPECTYPKCLCEAPCNARLGIADSEAK